MEMNAYVSYQNAAKKEGSYVVNEYYSTMANYSTIPPLFNTQKLTNINANHFGNNGVIFQFTRPLEDAQEHYLKLAKGTKYRVALVYNNKTIPSNPAVLQVHDNNPYGNRKQDIDLLDEEANLCPGSPATATKISFVL